MCADTGGSCRIPASLNGVAGLRPTKGCYANDDGIVPLSSTRDTPGRPLQLSIQDSHPAHIIVIA